MDLNEIFSLHCFVRKSESKGLEAEPQSSEKNEQEESQTSPTSQNEVEQPLAVAVVGNEEPVAGEGSLIFVKNCAWQTNKFSKSQGLREVMNFPTELSPYIEKQEFF